MCQQRVAKKASCLLLGTYCDICYLLIGEPERQKVIYSNLQTVGNFGAAAARAAAAVAARRSPAAQLQR